MREEKNVNVSEDNGAQDQSVQVDFNDVIASLRNQLAQKCNEVAERDALISKLARENQAMSAEIASSREIIEEMGKKKDA